MRDIRDTNRSAPNRCAVDRVLAGIQEFGEFVVGGLPVAI